MNFFNPDWQPLFWMAIGVLASAGAPATARLAMAWLAQSSALPQGFAPERLSRVLAAIVTAIVPSVAFAWHVGGMRPALWGLAESPLADGLAEPGQGWLPVAPWLAVAVVTIVASLIVARVTRRSLILGQPAAAAVRRPEPVAEAIEMVITVACLEWYWAFVRAAVLSVGEGRPVFSVAIALGVLAAVPWLQALTSTEPSKAAELGALQRGVAAVISAFAFLATGWIGTGLAAHLVYWSALWWLAPSPAPLPEIGAAAEPLDIEPTVV